MGPDCGTAVISGIPLGFANEVRAGRVGLVGASGTGLQQVSSLLHSMGAGVSHVIGTGSRDVSAEVGGLTMRAGLDALAADPATDVIVLVSKPPASHVADQLLGHAGALGKPVVACFLGTDEASPAPARVTLAPTLFEAARSAASLLPAGRSRPAKSCPSCPPPLRLAACCGPCTRAARSPTRRPGSSARCSVASPAPLPRPRRAQPRASRTGISYSTWATTSSPPGAPTR